MGAGASVTLPEHAQAHFDKLNDEQKEKWSKYFQDLKAEGGKNIYCFGYHKFMICKII